MRPVYHLLTLEELVKKSDVIVVVERAQPPEATIQKEDDGCMSNRRPVTVQEVLKAPDGGVHRDDALNVIVNEYALLSCGYAMKNRSVSYAALRYNGADPADDASPSRRFVLFLQNTPRGPELAAEHASESEARVADIVKLIKP